MANPCPLIAFEPADAGPEPVALLIDIDRRLLDTNRAAEALLGAEVGLARLFGRLTAASQSDIARIEQGIAEARWRGISSVVLSGGEFEAEIIRMGQDRLKPAFLVLSRREKRDGHAVRAQQRFGLTPAESRVLNCLLKGLPLKETADRLGVAPTTARTHLQRIFDKTGVRRQTDLQRVIALA